MSQFVQLGIRTPQFVQLGTREAQFVQRDYLEQETEIQPVNQECTKVFRKICCLNDNPIVLNKFLKLSF